MIDNKTIKQLAQNGVLRIIGEAAKELQKEQEPPKFMGEETMYELGRYWGAKEGVKEFIEELYNIAENGE